MNATIASQNRATFEDLYRHSHYFADRWPLRLFTDAVSEFVCVMNSRRQIVFGNSSLVHYLKLEHTDDVIGKKFGDLFQCVNAVNSKGGCGTTEACTLCGAYRASIEGLNGRTAEKECRIICEPDASALEMKVRATPLTINNEQFTIIAATDISNEKRRKVLESVFFHDVLNVAGGLAGYSELLKDASEEESKEFALIINGLTLELVDQIEAQRDLSHAEQNEMTVREEVLHSLSILRSAATTYTKHVAAVHKHIVIDDRSEDFIFTSDEKMLKRIIGNFTKNALEASGTNETVTIGCRRSERSVQFWVHNRNVIPRETQLQIFQRSFSTKKTGSGWGTYGSKLFAERYLGGKVFFVSNEDDGTRFSVELPFLNSPAKNHTTDPDLHSPNGFHIVN